MAIASEASPPASEFESPWSDRITFLVLPRRIIGSFAPAPAAWRCSPQWVSKAKQKSATVTGPASLPEPRYKRPAAILHDDSSLVTVFDGPRLREAAASSGRMAATIDACDGAREAMHGGHTPDRRRAHRFGSLRGCACARSEAVPERPHLSSLQ